MNIFYLDRNVRLCAEAHCDKHVSKMIIEYAQLMSTAHHETNSSLAPHCYRRTHVNHPSAVWVRESQDHYSWLYELFRELNNVYSERYRKTHATWTKLANVLCHNPSLLPALGWQDPPQCMPDEFKANDVVEAYRNYYRMGKPFARWAHTPTPSWFYAPPSVVPAAN